MRKMIARLMSLVLILNLALCAPLAVAAEGTEGEVPVPPADSTFEADQVEIVKEGEDPYVAVTDDAEPADGSGIEISNKTSSKPNIILDQSVTVEVPLDEVITQQPANGTTIESNEDEDAEDATESDEGKDTADAIEYETPSTKDPAETTPVEEALDVTAEITKVEKAGYNLTDITYEVSLDQKTTVGGGDDSSVEIKQDIDQDWDEDTSVKVELSVNGMKDDPTRVEHTEGDKTEYFYNDKYKDESDTTKKYFTVVETVVENVKKKVVSLWTNFLGTFHITNDAFEGAADDNGKKDTYSDLATAVNNAEAESTVEMLRDYSTSKTASISSADHVTVDLGGHTYTHTGTSSNPHAINVEGSGVGLTIQNGTVSSGTYSFYKTNTASVFVGGSGNTVTLNNMKIFSNQRNLQNAFSIGVWNYNKNNTFNLIKTDISSGGSYFGICHNGSYGGSVFNLVDSTVTAKGAEGAGIYISGSEGSTGRDGLNNLKLTNSTVVGDTGAEVKYTNVMIENSTLIGEGSPADYIENNNGSTTVGAALAITDNRKGTSVDKTSGTITIKSGYFYGHEEIDSIFLPDKRNEDDTQAGITILGGRFENVSGLRTFLGENCTLISHNYPCEYPYEVMAFDSAPTRPGYTFQGYKDDQGNAITLEKAKENGVIAYAQWAAIPAVEDSPAAEPVPTPAPEAPKADNIIVEPDSQGNNVEVTVEGTTAVVTVTTPEGASAAVSEVTITSAQELQEQGVETVSIQVEENVTLEVGVSETAQTGLGDTIVVTKEADTLVVSDGEASKITIHMGELKAAAEEALHIKYDEGVITISFGSNVVFRMEVLEALKANKDLTVKLEGKVLKLYDKNQKLLQEIPM